MARALIFPGQGSQKIGMADALVNGYRSGREVMNEIEDAISFKISRLISDGPIEELTKTSNAQPAIFATGMACVIILEQEYGYNLHDNKYFAGHSLGEYTALCAAGALSIGNAARLIKLRGILMESACSSGEDYAMVALLGVGADVIDNLVEPYHDGRNMCVVANDNSPQQVVISGHRDAVMTVSEESRNHGVIKAIELKVGGAFHSPIMGKAAIEFDKILLEEAEFHDCNVPVIMNTTALPLTSKDELHSCLVSQMTGRVRWRETIDLLYNDAEISEVVEIAPGRTLSTMMKRSYPDARVRSLETVAQIEEFIHDAFEAE
ncbi:MAG: ACP S-malonyltransferase [Holosporales bacterium]|jgi:[acyl-carrier-protein] S-malonyltransferase|nr:ACP S-malonyltransferase [Holosporales bacterium]